MKTNFFHQLQALNIKGCTMNILAGENGKMTVSVLLTPQKTDKDFPVLPPLIFKRTADELSEGFFNDLSAPVQETNELFSNIETYKQSLEQAKADLAKKNAESKAKAKTNEDKKDTAGTSNKEEKKKAYVAIIKQLTELNDACKYEEALALLPTVEDYPEKEADIKKRTEDLTRKRDQKAQAMELFNA